MSAISPIATSTQQIANSASTVASSLARPHDASTSSASTSSGVTSTSSSSSTITANDFLTLLVAEMKNQDPTQPTDPNQYISQMVDVNSLQQLIGINQGITSLDTAAGGSAGGTAASPGTGTTGSTGSGTGS